MIDNLSSPATSDAALHEGDFEPHLRDFYFSCGVRSADAGVIRLTE